jgi:hypothetical protein
MKLINFNLAIMPPKSDKDARNLIETEGKIEMALSDVKNGKISSIRQAAIIYGVLRSMLCRRQHGVQRQAISNANKRKLTRSEEDTLVQWILLLDKRGFPPRPEALSVGILFPAGTANTPGSRQRSAKHTACRIVPLGRM